MAPFGGWDMPIQYEGILAETRAVRSGAGMFDVSHMGRVEITGPGAAAFLNRVFSSDVPKLRIGRARYGVICNPQGGIIDDAIVYRLAEKRYLLVPNAGNANEIIDWLSKWAPDDGATMDIITDKLAMIAVQGPTAVGILDAMTTRELSKVRQFRIVDAPLMGTDALLARTGYTGEDGFEVMLPSGSAATLWEALTEAGVIPCGLGSRDVLRLEAGLPLHGNDIDAATNPYEAGLGRFVDPDRDGYVAGDTLQRIRDTGPERSLVGFVMRGRGIARQGHPIMNGPEQIGVVTSGSISPTLDMNIGMGYVPNGFSDTGTRLQIDVRGRSIEAEVTPLPFYSRRKSE
jgi:aminomethyltransferase